MKPLLLITLACVSFFAFNIAPIQAQALNPSPQSASNFLSPLQLIKLARQGRFKAQGIPAAAALHSALRSGRVNAQLLVEGAVAQNRLPHNALQDAQYLQAVEAHLKSGGCGSL